MPELTFRGSIANLNFKDLKCNPCLSSWIRDEVDLTRLKIQALSLTKHSTQYRV